MKQIYKQSQFKPQTSIQRQTCFKDFELAQQKKIYMMQENFYPEQTSQWLNDRALQEKKNAYNNFFLSNGEQSIKPNKFWLKQRMFKVLAGIFQKHHYLLNFQNLQQITAIPNLEAKQVRNIKAVFNNISKHSEKSFLSINLSLDIIVESIEDFFAQDQNLNQSHQEKVDQIIMNLEKLQANPQTLNLLATLLSNTDLSSVSNFHFVINEFFEHLFIFNFILICWQIEREKGFMFDYYFRLFLCSGGYQTQYYKPPQDISSDQKKVDLICHSFNKKWILKRILSDSLSPNRKSAQNDEQNSLHNITDFRIMLLAKVYGNKIKQKIDSKNNPRDALQIINRHQRYQAEPIRYDRIQKFIPASDIELHIRKCFIQFSICQQLNGSDIEQVKIRQFYNHYLRNTCIKCNPHVLESILSATKCKQSRCQ